MGQSNLNRLTERILQNEHFMPLKLPEFLPENGPNCSEREEQAFRWVKATLIASQCGKESSAKRPFYAFQVVLVVGIYIALQIKKPEIRSHWKLPELLLRMGQTVQKGKDKHLDRSKQP
ncbi:hypothetical protein CEXT_215871 [Caerostris extrusa]|uniref:Transposase n=1 Tax=Caerostris extrusa TaxID=172846 RepID=A0AAV4QH12_CAEEX|nr:hypothetical protein CEXT_215871 [Caerostris extrusa]